MKQRKFTQEEGLADAYAALQSDEGLDNTSVAGLKSVLESVSVSCAKYVKALSSAPPFGNTKLDRERQKLCLWEIVSTYLNSYKVKDFLDSSVYL